jgi:hypothetical protein
MGSLDEAPADVASLENELTARGAPDFVIQRFSRTMHAFTVFNGTRYSARADASSWRAGLEFLRPDELRRGTAEPLFVGDDGSFDLSQVHSDPTRVVELAARLGAAAQTDEHFDSWTEQLVGACGLSERAQAACRPLLDAVFHKARRHLRHEASSASSSSSSSSSSS